MLDQAVAPPAFKKMLGRTAGNNINGYNEKVFSTKDSTDEPSLSHMDRALMNREIDPDTYGEVF